MKLQKLTFWVRRDLEEILIRACQAMLENALEWRSISTNGAHMLTE